MNRDIVYGVIFVMGMFTSCHTRKVSASRVDSLARHDSSFVDRSVITTHTHLDTTFYILAHTIAAPPHKVFAPFVVQDSLMTLAVSYDSSGNVIAKATERARVLVAKIEQTIVKQNNIIAKVQNEVHVIKKEKATKSYGMEFGAIALMVIGGVGLVALVIHYIVTKKII